MQWVHQRVRLSNTTDASSQIDGFFGMMCESDRSVEKRLSRNSFFRLRKKPIRSPVEKDVVRLMDPTV